MIQRFPNGGCVTDSNKHASSRRGTADRDADHTASNAANNSANNADWVTAWLETQRNWLGRWQALNMEQRVDATRVVMETLRQHFSPTTFSNEALNVVQSFQTLVQAGMAQAGSMAEQFQVPGGAAGATDESTRNVWQQLIAAFPVGYAREQQVAWQEYIRAQADYQLRLQTLLQAFSKVFAQSLEIVPHEVELRARAGKPVQGFRELYELWIECGERVFAEFAHDDAFITAQAEASNALNRLKRTQQTLLDHWLKSYDLPTRAELNTVHQRMRDMNSRLVEMERQLAASKAESVKPKRARKTSASRS